MASLSEHADNIKAAIKAAKEDGFKLESDVVTVHRNGDIVSVDLDLTDDRMYVTVFSEEY